MYGMRFAQIAQDMCNYLDAQTQDLAPNEALAAKKMIIRKLCRGEGLDVRQYTLFRSMSLIFLVTPFRWRPQSF